MASAKLSGPPGLSLEDEEEDDQAITEPLPEPDGETVAGFPVFYQTGSHDCNPYFPFSDSNSDSGSVSCPDAGPDTSSSIIDFFDRESFEVDAVEEFYSGPDPGLMIVGDFNLWGFHDAEEDEVGDELGLGLGVASNQQRGDADRQGLRVTGIDSDSDYEDGVFDLNASDNGNEETESGRVEDSTGLPPVWDSFFAEEPVVADEELEWEEVQNAITWTHEPVQGVDFNRPEEGEELSSSSRISSRDDQEHDLDWQVLLAVNNVVNYIEQAEGISIGADDIDANYYLYLANIDDYGETHGDYDAIFGQMFDNETGLRGSPPAAKRVVEDLPFVELTVEELGKGDIICAVCKDEMAIEEKVRRLPCRHYYHGDCILPWLGIRNTCPVCRYELPTDDPEYERSRRQQTSDIDLARDPSVR